MEYNENQQHNNNTNLERYKDSEGLSYRKLSFGLWYVEHKKLFRDILIGFLIAVSAVSWTYTLYGFAHYIFWGMKEDQVLAREMAQSYTIGHDYLVQISASDLEYSKPRVFVAQNKNLDFLVKIKNPNEKHFANFDYSFIIGTEETETKRGFIFPLEEKYLLILNQGVAENPAVMLNISDLKWQRLDSHEIKNWEAFKNERINIKTESVKYLSAEQNERSEKVDLNTLEFSTKNNSPYNYWEVDHNIIMHSKSGISGVNKYTVLEFLSGEERNVELSWPGRMGGVSTVEIFTDINILDNNVYLKFDGGVGKEK